MGFLASALIWKRCQTGLAARWQYIRFFYCFVFCIFHVFSCTMWGCSGACCHDKHDKKCLHWKQNVRGKVATPTEILDSVASFSWCPSSNINQSSLPVIPNWFSSAWVCRTGSGPRPVTVIGIIAARMSQECFPHLSWLCVTKNSDELGSKLRQIKLALKVNHRIYFVYRCFFQSGCYLSFSTCACWGGGSFLSKVHPLAECNAVCFSTSVLVVSRFSPSHRPTSPPPLKISTARDGLCARSCSKL